MNIICVCTGNTCRSPMAAALLNRALARRGLTLNVRSAGLVAREGEPASDQAIRVMGERGLDLTGHRAHTIDARDVEDALLVCMTRNHAIALNTRFPGARTVLLTELAGMSGDIPDPYGGDHTVYAACADALETLAERIAALLAGGPA